MVQSCRRWTIFHGKIEKNHQFTKYMRDILYLLIMKSNHPWNYLRCLYGLIFQCTIFAIDHWFKFDSNQSRIDTLSLSPLQYY